MSSHPNQRSKNKGLVINAPAFSWRICFSRRGDVAGMAIVATVCASIPLNHGDSTELVVDPLHPFMTRHRNIQDY
jgi:hypothetical protein